ncbi:bifunctional diguanylate cyclase/phosphodiesterase [Holdemania massiliensis]|uniref:bifunctional diguanylate cyclase/phosphodiesterase n=1 Tax=Holdemania massiliensis TaxID=1468449 RepID=UPI001F0516CF|nr:bifunctional diguanylate cyclase/phosphodiesterase [Holdemania massiliensis]MCH1942268.1 EAL domain-containing protein [Holdemania massiliensis]
MLKKRSVFNRILIPLIIVQIFQISLFGMLVFNGGVITKLDRNAEEILNERVINRKNYLENEMIQRWSNFSIYQTKIEEEIEQQLAEAEMTVSDLVPGAKLTSNILKTIGPDLVALMRRNTVTGVFLVFEGTPVEIGEGESAEKSGLYLRDLDPINNPYDNSDLLMERSPTDVAQALGIAMDVGWSPRFKITAESYFYNNPVQAIRSVPELEREDAGYWGYGSTLNEAMIKTLTYSQPLVASDGTVLGVLGISLADDYLKTMLPAKELLSDQSGSYMLAILDESQAAAEGLTLQKVTHSGGVFIAMFGEAEELVFQMDQEISGSGALIHTEALKLKQRIYGSLQPLDLYNTNAPFSHQRWVLVGLESRDALYGFSRKIQNTILTFMILSMLVGLTATIYASYRPSRQIGALARKVRNSDPNRPIHLDPIRITEIDQLSQAIEELSKSVAENSSRLSQIIGMLSIQIGAFEIDPAKNSVFCTSGFFDALQPQQSHEDQMLTLDQFSDHLHQLNLDLGDLGRQREKLIKLEPQSGGARWLRLKTAALGQTILGVIQDVTAEMVERHRIEYERDYDVLTNLLNRRAFQRFAQERFEHPERLKITAFMMMDLDNLKYINDTYGHDCGDGYIRSAADVLRSNAGSHEIAARMSGDEFYVLFYGYDTDFQIRQKIEQIRKAMAAYEMDLPDGKRIRIRASFGVSWYPKDSRNLEELIKYADFAMYEIKNSVKGGIKDFEIESYQKDSFMLHSSEDLNRLIENELIDFVFQPIIDVASQTVYGYEMLMRPKMEKLPTPSAVLRIARAQSRLYQIEHLTWFKAMETIDRYHEHLKGKKLFINSISSLRLTPEDLAELDRRFGQYNSQVVIELTESEKMGEQATLHKRKRCVEQHQEIALDDYGTGYNGEATLLDLMPNYVKIDMSIIRGIDQDLNRREFYEGLVVYFRSRHIKILAEGVETRAEMEVLIECGTDYMQGFYFRKGELTPPQPDPEAMEELRKAVKKKAKKEQPSKE